MSGLEIEIAAFREVTRREKIRCICILACVVIVVSSALGVMFYLMPPPGMGATAEPVTYTHTNENGATVTTTINGNTTTTIVTNATGKVISTSITSGRRRK